MTILRKARHYLNADAGGMTSFSLFLTATLLLAGGYAIDVSNLTNERTHLQMTADSAANAALVTRELDTEANARLAAIAIAEGNMPPLVYGNVINANRITFGVWNPDTRKFQAQAGSRTAVQVVARRNANNANSINTYLMHLAGVDEWNVTLASTYMTYQPTCFREGFVAVGPVDLQSNNSFTNGFCIHSNDYVSLNSNNYFEPGTVVSMPDVADLDIPNSGFRTNIGLQAALRAGSYNIRILKRIADIIATIDEPGSIYRPAYITTTATTTLTRNRIGAADLIAGRVHYWNCGSSTSKGTIEGGTLVSNVVILATCEVTLASGVALEDAVIATSSTSDNSFSSPSGFRLGRNDNCAEGGGAQLVTTGGMSFAANLEIYGGQLLAARNIAFAARAAGIQGVAMVSGATISGTSNMAMGFCGSGMENNFKAEYFRMVD